MNICTTWALTPRKIFTFKLSSGTKIKGIYFVDGKKAHEVNESIPITKAKVMMNAWAGKNVDDWLKPFNDKNLPIIAEYEWVRFTPFEDE